jgi:16S rRNA (guanine527-N7)-methyltransferase
MTSPIPLQQELARALSGLHLEVSRALLARHLCFWDLLVEESARFDLLSPGALRQGPVRHIADALAACTLGPLPGRWLDLGSGAGLPGIPLALADPDSRVVLLETRERRCDWLRRAVTRLELADRVTVVTGRLEEQPAAWTKDFPLITARAVAPPDRLLPMLLPRMARGARLYLWHSDAQTDSITDICLGEPLKDLEVSISTHSYHFNSINFSSNISVLTLLD